VTPYWQDGTCSLYLGDCREVTAWLEADVLVTDPPYGIGYGRRRGTWDMPAARPEGIEGDRDTALRDAVLAQWPYPAVMFGDLKLAIPARTTQVLVYRKPPDSGTHGAAAGFRHDIEAVYLIGKWPHAIGGRSSVLDTGARMVGGQFGPAGRYGHPHAKPVDVMETLIAACPPGTIADPFAGSGSTLVAARNQGRRYIGVELEERYCERAALRLSQASLFAGDAS
jgi:site-specific DNA-methyltransferase (adenine-specific)